MPLLRKRFKVILKIPRTPLGKLSKQLPLAPRPFHHWAWKGGFCHKHYN
ncbi:MAG TPA: hypothetical protein O0X00_06585 [Methanocorpusculum sp.]|nr:hypothetical protein [Methanocorpusculum sp.]